VPDDLYSRVFLAVLLLEFDVLDQEEATFHPLVGNPPLHVTGQLPSANQPVQTPQVGARLPPVGPGIVGVVTFRHERSSLDGTVIFYSEDTIIVLQIN